MGILSNLIDRIVNSSVAREREDRHDRRASMLGAVVEGPPPGVTRQFTILTALNGSYIEFSRRKYNPNGPDEYQREIYIVQPGEALIDAISTVLVLTEK
jgi:hypothetical protein